MNCACRNAKPFLVFLAAFGVLVAFAFAALAAWSVVVGLLFR